MNGLGDALAGGESQPTTLTPTSGTGQNVDVNQLLAALNPNIAAGTPYGELVKSAALGQGAQESFGRMGTYTNTAAAQEGGQLAQQIQQALMGGQADLAPVAHDPFQGHPGEGGAER